MLNAKMRLVDVAFGLTKVILETNPPLINTRRSMMEAILREAPIDEVITVAADFLLRQADAKFKAEAEHLNK